MAIQIQYRRGTAAEWTSANPTLAVGEPGYETDTGKFKVGNGSTAWNSLAYSSGITGDKGGAPYVFSTTTTAADPGTGTIRYNNATFSSISAIYIDNTDINSVSMTSWYDNWATTTNTHYGYLTIMSRTTGTAIGQFRVTAIASISGYYNLSVTPLSGTIPANGESIIVHFSPAGDKGDTGATGAKGGLFYTFSTTTTDADPGNGFFRFNAANTQMFIDLVDGDGTTQTTFIDSWDDSTSTLEGTLVIQSRSTSAYSSVWSVTGWTTATGYRKITVSNVSGTIPSNNQECVITFTRTGDKGDTGNTGATGSMGPKSVSLLAPTNAENITLFYTSSALTVSKISSAIRGGTSVTFTIRYGTNRSDTGTEVVTGGTVANSTAGLYTTSFNNASIPASRWVWLVTTAVSGVVNELAVSLEF